MMSTVILYTREGCHLCEQALASLERLRLRLPFELSVRDIDAEPELQRAYFERIPVVALDGEEICEYVLDEEELIDRLSRVDEAGPAIL